MPMYEIQRQERGVLTKTYRVKAETADDANEMIWEGEVEPQDSYFKQQDCCTTTRALKDCDCTICKRRGAWACQENEE